MGTVAVTSTGRRSWATRHTVAITAAAPAMSLFMCSMFAAGLIEMPPLSNVMPLPTSAIFFRAPGPPVAQAEQPRLADRAAADGQDAAVAAGGQRVLVEDLGGQAELLAGRGAAGGELGRVQVVRRGVDQVADQGDGVGDGAHPAQRRLGLGGAGDDDREVARRRLAVGAQVGLVGGELVGAEQRALADGVQALGVRGATDGGEQADHRAASGQRAAGGAGGAAHRLGRVGARGVGRAEAGDRDDRERPLPEGRQPGDLVLGAARAQVGQRRQQAAAEQAVDRLGARAWAAARRAPCRRRRRRRRRSASRADGRWRRSSAARLDR